MARWFARISLWTEYLSCCILFYLLASFSMDYEHVYTLSRLSRCNIRSEHKFRGISDTWIHLEYLISITFISDFNVVVSNIHFIWFSCFYFVFFSLLTWKNKSARNSCLQWNSLLISFYSFIRGALFCRFINKRPKPYLLAVSFIALQHKHSEIVCIPLFYAVFVEIVKIVQWQHLHTFIHVYIITWAIDLINSCVNI